LITNQHFMAKKKAAAKASEPDQATQIYTRDVPADTVKKLQVIAGLEGVTNNEVYKKAFDTFVSLYEQKHGKIKLKEKGSGLDVI
jgi:hypothetical protein